MKNKSATYLFESSWKKKYTTRGIRKTLAKYSELEQTISPHKLRHFLITWLKKELTIRLFSHILAMKAVSHLKYNRSCQLVKHRKNMKITLANF